MPLYVPLGACGHDELAMLPSWPCSSARRCCRVGKLWLVKVGTPTRAGMREQAVP